MSEDGSEVSPPRGSRQAVNLIDSLLTTAASPCKSFSAHFLLLPCSGLTHCLLRAGISVGSDTDVWAQKQRDSMPVDHFTDEEAELAMLAVYDRWQRVGWFQSCPLVSRARQDAWNQWNGDFFLTFFFCQVRAYPSFHHLLCAISSRHVSVSRACLVV